MEENKKHPLEKWLDVQTRGLPQRKFQKWLIVPEHHKIFMIESEKAASDPNRSIQQGLEQIVNAAKNATWKEVLRSSMACWIQEVMDQIPETKPTTVDVCGVRCLVQNLQMLIAILPAEQLMITAIQLEANAHQAKKSLMFRFKVAGKSGCVLLAECSGKLNVKWEDFETHLGEIFS